jgi:hypothetical protein
MPETQLTKPKWTRRKNAIVVIAAILFLTLAPIFTLLFWEMHVAEKVFNSFNQALIAKQYETAYAITTPALKANVTYEAFVGVQNRLEARVGALRSFTRISSEVKDDEAGFFATIHARLVFDKGELSFAYVLKKENGHWLIYSFNEL